MFPIKYKGDITVKKSILKNILLCALVLLSVISVSACNGEKIPEGSSTTAAAATTTKGGNYGKGDVIGTYVFLNHSKIDELTFTYMNYIIRINEDGTYTETGDMVAKNAQSHGKTTINGVGTWTIEANYLVLKNDANFVSKYKIDGDIISYTNNFDETITFKKE